MKTPNHKCFITGGGSEVDGELLIWQELNSDAEGQSLFRDPESKSVYAISISPAGKYVAAGSKIGLIRIWPFLDHKLQKNAPSRFEIYHQLGRVTALAFLTDDLLISAGVNGKIRVISISQKKFLIEIEAHLGPICSVVALGSRVVASLGIDGKLKIWDMDSLSCEFQKGGFLFPTDSFSLFPALAFSEKAGYLYCPSAEGKLFIFDLNNLCSHVTIKAHQDAFYAMTSCGKYLITGGMYDRRLKLWDQKREKPVNEIKIETSFLRLCSIGDGRAAAVCHDSNESQSLRLFDFPELKPSGIINGLSLRSIAAVPLPVFLYRQNVELKRLKDNLIGQAKSKIMNPEQMKPFLKQLAERGFWAEANLLQAESARLRNKPLHELGFLLQLTKNIKVSEATASVFHRLALLFEQLNEPEFSVRYFKRIKPFIEDSGDIIRRLEMHPLCNLEQKKTIRLDISLVDLAIQEMEKDTVLGQPFRWRLVLQSREPRVFIIQSLNNLDLWEKSIREHTYLKNRSIEMEQENVIFFDGQNRRELSWLKISNIGVGCPSPLLDYAIEINQKNDQAQGYGIFNPNKMADLIDNVFDHNFALAQTYRSIHHKKEVENWLNQVHNGMKRLDRQSSFARS